MKKSIKLSKLQEKKFWNTKEIEKSRGVHVLYTIDEFAEELNDQLQNFISNIKNLNINDKCFPSWYDLFRAWLEIGTDMEGMYYRNESKPTSNKRNCE